MSVLHIRGDDGKFHDLVTVRGLEGKTAYQYAQDGGYTGTEEEFAEKLAAEYLDTDAPVLRYDPQTLTAEQQAVARGNIGAQEQDGVYELIETITVEEDNITTINRTQEPDGTPYNFTELLVLLTMNKGTVSSQVNVWVNGTTRVMQLLKAINANALYCSHARFWNEKGFLKAQGGDGVQRGVPNAMLDTTTAFQTTAKAQNIESMRVQVPANSFVPVGSTIEIWGVRA